MIEEQRRVKKEEKRGRKRGRQGEGELINELIFFFSFYSIFSPSSPFFFILSLQVYFVFLVPIVSCEAGFIVIK